MPTYLGIDCGSISLNLALVSEAGECRYTVYRRTSGRPLETLMRTIDELSASYGERTPFQSAFVTGSGRELLSHALEIPAVNEITAHATGVYFQDSRVRTVIEIGGQDSKFMALEPTESDRGVRIHTFRMNEVCAAGTGAFLDEQAGRLGIPIEEFGPTALLSERPAPIAGRCTVFAKTDMIHQAQEGTPLQDILLGLAYALVRNYVATLVRGERLEPVVSLQGGVMHNPAVVEAFRTLLDLSPEQVTIPNHFDVLGAVGAGIIASRKQPVPGLSLHALKQRVEKAMLRPVSRTCRSPLSPALHQGLEESRRHSSTESPRPPFVLGLDVGSVSVKGVLIDGSQRILKHEYLLSRSRPRQAMQKVVDAIMADGPQPDYIAVTGSGRHLIGSLLDADLIVNEITAQTRAAISHDSRVDTIVEIGGQDSKWISLSNGDIQNFEMNRVCSAGTGSFLMEQGERLGIPMEAFADAAFASEAPADLGTRCTVFMESDLIHHQNNGATSEDLAAGVCMSIVHNYLDRVANNRTLGKNIVFLGGVASNTAVRAAFEQKTGRRIEVPSFFRVSGALGAALKVLDGVEAGTRKPGKVHGKAFTLKEIRKEQFTCQRCPNRCTIDKYLPDDRIVFHGGLCDRWEVGQGSREGEKGVDLFRFRSSLLESFAPGGSGSNGRWGIVRSPLFYEWFPFWAAFCAELGIQLDVAKPTDRQHFEEGSRFLKVETCLPIKAMAGQLADLVGRGVRTIFQPSIVSEPSGSHNGQVHCHCPYIQACSQFFRGSFQLEWKEPVVHYELDPDTIRRDHVRFAAELGHRTSRVERAVQAGLDQIQVFHKECRTQGERFIDSLGEDRNAIVVLGKPYHNSDPFLNMNLGSLFTRLGVPAIPGDLLDDADAPPSEDVRWKYQSKMVRTARRIARDRRLFPVFITFFGCGPDPFTVRHVQDALAGKPLLTLEMDELTSRAGIQTRVEAFLDRIHKWEQRSGRPRDIRQSESTIHRARAGYPEQNPERRRRKSARPSFLFIPNMGDVTYGFAAAARSVGIDARPLSPPDRESELLGLPHLVGGECHPFALVLGDYLKLARSRSSETTGRSRFFMIGPNACRLPQYPVNLEKIRRRLGHSIEIIGNVDDGLQAFGISQINRHRLMLKAWEGMNAYDLLYALYRQIRPFAEKTHDLEAAYERCREKVFTGLSENRVRQGMEEALHELYRVPIKSGAPRPIVAVTGDYYTRIVPYANNDVYDEVERLGGVLWTPPTFTDSFKMGSLRDAVWSLANYQARDAAEKTLLYLLMLVSEFKVKGGKRARGVAGASEDLLGRQMWRRVERHVHTRLPAGISAPVATVEDQLDRGASGVLNLMTLNCSYGTVVTATLSRALRMREPVPMLTLIYDGLKKTNEKTRLEAFMEQVHDRFQHHRVDELLRALFTVNP